MNEKTLMFLSCLMLLTVGVTVIGIIDIVAMLKGVDGVLMAGSFSAISVIVAVPFVHYYHLRKKL